MSTAAIFQSKINTGQLVYPILLLLYCNNLIKLYSSSKAGSSSALGRIAVTTNQTIHLWKMYEDLGETTVLNTRLSCIDLTSCMGFVD